MTEWSPAVLVVSSHVVRGSVGGRAGFVFERFGFRLWSLPTVILPWHPGHGGGTRVVPPADAFASMALDLAGSPRLAEVAAVVTGYLGSPSQADAVAGLVRAVKAANPAAIHLADPVIGDAGGLYVPAEVAAAQAAEILPLADVATPNRFELAYLTRRDTDAMKDLVAAARDLGPARVVVTSAPAMMRGFTGVAAVDEKRVLVAENRVVERAPSGTGDLFAALWLSRILGGQSDEAALAGALASTHDVLAASATAGTGELELAGRQEAFLRPSTAVEVRLWAEPRRPGASR
jgi:pyridoxine kinase